MLTFIISRNKNICRELEKIMKLQHGKIHYPLVVEVVETALFKLLFELLKQGKTEPVP